MILPRFLIRYMAVAASAGLAGLSGTFLVLAFVGGHHELNVWDVLLVVQIGGLPAAAAVFHLTCSKLLGRPPLWPVELLLFALAQIALPPFFRFVVRSELTGNQGIIIVIATLVVAGGFLAWSGSLRSCAVQPRQMGAK